MTTWSARPVAILILAGVIVLGAVLAVIGAIRPAGGTDGGKDSAARNAVTSRANDFAVAYNTYDVAKLDDYQARLKDLLTPTYDKQFVQVTNAVFGALKDKKQRSGDAKVLGVAVQSIDDDSAVAIVAVDASITNTDNKAAVLRHFRWKVTFSESKGEWLVSDFESVAAVAAEASPVTPTPTPAPGAAEGDAQ